MRPDDEVPVREVVVFVPANLTVLVPIAATLESDADPVPLAHVEVTSADGLT